MINYFLHVAMEAFMMNNFSLVISIMSALGANINVTRLGFTFLELDKNAMQVLAEVTKIASPEHKYEHLKPHIALVDDGTPSLPNFALCMQNLVLISDGNEESKGTTVNFGKHMLLASQLEEIGKFAGSRYIFSEVPEIQKMLLNPDILPDEAAYEESLSRESRQDLSALKPKNKDKAHARKFSGTST